MIGHRRAFDACSGVELVLTALLSQTYAALSKVGINPIILYRLGASTSNVLMIRIES
jgi:hypothetical protein